MRGNVIFIERHGRCSGRESEKGIEGVHKGVVYIYIAKESKRGEALT